MNATIGYGATIPYIIRFQTKTIRQNNTMQVETEALNHVIFKGIWAFVMIVTH